jgi:uncharacterized membrane protein (UPF0127 family)
MDVDRPTLAAVALFAALTLAVLSIPYLPMLGGLGGDGTATVTALGGDETLAVVEAEVADTPAARERGLSNTTRLENGTGMLFVFPTESSVAFVMRDMNYPLDMVFVGSDGEITTVHSAPVPPEGTPESELERYRGTAKWVLEVPRGWAARNNVSAGDSVRIER